MRLLQPSNGYRYNSDTLMLYDFILRQGCSGDVLDVGCGCGVLGLLIKRDVPKCTMHAIDIQAQNVALTAQNAQENALELRVEEGDFLSLSWHQAMDVIISNPPFYHDGTQKSQDLHVHTSRYNTHLPLGDFLAHVKRVLKPHGKLLFCYDAKQLGAIMQHLHDAHLTLTTLQCVYPKASKSASLVLLEAKRSSKSLCEILPPLVVNDNDGPTPQAQAIFSKAATVSVSC
ncbi:MAG: methyltransferase [Campylobacterales bacterium]|nr:methyltransferase [Campylobacterales bacterium]